LALNTVQASLRTEKALARGDEFLSKLITASQVNDPAIN
jgi:hypothetical protein